MINSFGKKYLSDQQKLAVQTHQQRIAKAKSILPKQDLLYLLKKHHRKHHTSNHFRNTQTQRKTHFQNQGIQRRLFSHLKHNIRYQRQSKLNSRLSLRISKDHEQKKEIYQQNIAFSNRLSAIPPTIRNKQLHKSYRQSRRYKRIVSHKQKINDMSGPTLLQSSQTLLVVQLKPMGKIFFQLTLQLKNLNFPCPKLQYLAYKLKFNIKAKSILQRKFIATPMLHYQRKIYNSSGLKQVHRSTSKSLCKDKDHLVIPSQIVSYQQLQQNAFLFKGGFAKLLQYSQVDLFIGLVAIHNDWQQEIAFFTIVSGQNHVQVFGKKGKSIGVIQSFVQLSIGSKKGVEQQSPQQNINKQLSPVGEQVEF